MKYEVASQSFLKWRERKGIRRKLGFGFSISPNEWKNEFTYIYRKECMHTCLYFNQPKLNKKWENKNETEWQRRVAYFCSAFLFTHGFMHSRQCDPIWRRGLWVTFWTIYIDVYTPPEIPQNQYQLLPLGIMHTAYRVTPGSSL